MSHLKRKAAMWTMLSELPPTVVEELAAISISRTFKRGDTLVYQGDPTSTVYYVTAGHAAVKVGTPYGDTVTVAILGIGDTFGELAHLTDREERTATVVAIDAVSARVIASREFERLRNGHPEIDRVLLRSLARRIDNLSERLAQTIYETVNRRCARRLLDAAAMFAGKDADEVIIPITQDDLAGLAGASRPTVNQVLGQLHDARIVSTGRGTITVHSVKALRSFAL
jgi:CRP/FNR family cyclic AMP-dependent transcriptional regulator